MTMFTSILSAPSFSLPKASLPLGQWIRLSSERRALGNLSEQQLRDIGIDASTAAAESARPFWDIPKGR